MCAQAVVILLDNSEESINGDFYPNRLEAERIAVVRLVQYYLRESAKTQVSIGTLAGRNAGIKSSLSSNLGRIQASIESIKRGGSVDLDKSIRSAFFALRHRDPDLKERRVITFIGTKHNLTAEKAEKLAVAANKEGVSLDIIAFGESVNDLEILNKLCTQLTEDGHFLYAENNSVILSDIVLSSEIGPGDGFRNVDIDNEDDPELAEVIRQSLMEANGMQYNNDNPDAELQEAIRASLMENSVEPQNDEQDIFDDPELAEAIKASLMENDVSNDNDVTSKENEEDYENDPEIQAALRASMEDNDAEIQRNLEDPEKMEKILSTLPGVDPNIIKKKKDDNDNKN